MLNAVKIFEGHQTPGEFSLPKDNLLLLKGGCVSPGCCTHGAVCETRPSWCLSTTCVGNAIKTSTLSLALLLVPTQSGGEEDSYAAEAFWHLGIFVNFNKTSNEQHQLLATIWESGGGELFNARLITSWGWINLLYGIHNWKAKILAATASLFPR